MTSFHTKKNENKISYTSIPKISIYLFKHFYFFRFISTQFADFASLKIQMQIIFAKPFNATTQPGQFSKQKILLVTDFIKIFII